MKIFIKSLYLLLLSLNLMIFAEEKPVVISLGDQCPVAQCLRHHNIRMQAYPFDWVITPFEGLYKLFEEDFENFFLKENLVLHPVAHFIGVLDIYSGSIYIHDFPIKEIPSSIKITNQAISPGTTVDNFLDYYDKVYKKYLRRVIRLKAILSSSNKVVFVRHGATKEQAIALRDLFETKYPDLDFALMILNTAPLEKWNEDRIQNYYIQVENFGKPESSDWLDFLHSSKILD